VRRLSGTTLLAMLMFCNCFCLGAFNPLLPEIGRASALADWQLGVVAGAFGFARMLADVPTGALAGRWLGATLAAAPATLLVGVAVVGWATSFEVLVLGRILMGLAHTFTTVAGLTAILQDDARGRAPSVRLNTFEFAGMLGILGGLGVVGMLPGGWGWGLSLWVASLPLVVPLAMVSAYRRRFDKPHRQGDSPSAAGSTPRPYPARTPSIVWVMFGVGTVIALSWSSVSQFIIPLRGAREFQLDRAGVSQMLVIAQLVDLFALLPVGWLADRIGRVSVLGLVAAAMGLGTWGIGLGSLPFFMVGCAFFGFGMAGWMLPLGIIREHTALAVLAWRTGLYRVGVDAAIFLGPLVCGLLGEAHSGVFVGAVGAVALLAGGWLMWRGLR